MASSLTPRGLLAKQIELMLGSGMVDVELDPEHYDLSITLGLEKLYQSSDGALLEKDIFVHITPDVSEYTLPSEVQVVRRLYRKGIGAYSNSGINFDPASAAFANIYMLQPNQAGGLATWDFYNQFLETTERVFASQYNFTWDLSSHKLTIIRRPTADEDIGARVYVRRSEDDIITDAYTGPWLRSYALAQARLILGQARSKYGSLAGASSVTLNGAALETTAKDEITKLEEQLHKLVTSDSGYGFVIG